MTPQKQDPSAPNLAFCFQEILALIPRLRSRKLTLGDSAVFRTHVRQELQQAHNAALALKYSQDEINYASFACVALLDETILTSSLPAFRDWAQKTLMHDLYKTGTAGETCFEHMRAALSRTESKASADLLEVYFLCLALGFQGQYAFGGGMQLRGWRDPMVEKILRTRGETSAVVVSRSWLPVAPVEVAVPSENWSRLALSICVGIAAACLLFGVGYYFLLSRGVANLAALVH
jgi:type VI secretion system protein ImpK